MDDDVPVEAQLSDERTLARVIAELRQWHVFRVAAAYAVGSWLLVQVIATIGPAFDAPRWVLRAAVLAAISGFLATMGFLLFRPRSSGKNRLPIYLSRRARIVAGVGVLLIAAAGLVWSIRSLSAREEISLAVLPFADLSPQRDKAYFAEGVGEEILSSLAAEKDIKVLGRTSARQIERNPDPIDVRRRLGVTHLLEGSARTAGNALRVNVRLIDTSDGRQLWEEEYRGRVVDVFNMQDQIAGTVVKRLRGTFFGGPVRAATPTAAGAYETYLAARSLMRTRSEETLVKALKLAEQLVKVEPGYAPGHALYAELVFLLSDESTAYGTIPVDKARAIALPHARKAIALAPEKPEGYAALGLILPPEESIEPLRRAIALDPARAELRNWLGLSFTRLDRHDEAYEQYVASADTEPLWPVAINQLVQVLATNGKTAEAMSAVRKYRARGGSEAQALRFMAHIARSRSDLSGSIAADRAALAKDQTVPYVREWLARAFAFLGDHGRAAAAWPRQSRYARLFFEGSYDELRDAVLADGAKAWSDPYVDAAIFRLGANRDWSALARLYATRPARFGDYCTVDPQFAPLMVIALRATGDPTEADRVFRCAWGRLEREQSMKHVSVYAGPGRLQFRKASLLAIRSDRRALDLIEEAVRRGWIGYYYSPKLSDWPQFDPFRSDPRYAALEQRMAASVARERSEMLAGR
jgi:TolB-like protein/Tfp pilus assembly protein PilF